MEEMKDTLANYREMAKKKKVKRIIAIVVSVLMVIGFLVSMKIVPSGHTGVVIHAGAVSNKVLTEGMHFRVPIITKIYNMNNRITRTDVDISSSSKDLQVITGTVSVNYRVSSSKSAELYKNVGKKYEDTIVRPAVQESTKGIMAQFTAEELTTERRIVSEEMKKALADKVSAYGLDVEELNIINFDFSEEFNKAIEAKQTAQQNALKAEQDLARIKIEAEQKIEQAKAEAETYRLQNQEITDKTLVLKYLEKWNGQLPTVVTDGQSIFDLNGILNQ